MSVPARIAVVHVLREERWPSMDLVGETTTDALRLAGGGEVEAEAFLPPSTTLLARARAAGKRLADVDRALNRHLLYPLRLRAARGRFDLFHVVDHSYAQLVHVLPPGRAIVTCHDLDAFRSLLEPAAEPRSAAFRAMQGRVLSGLRRAARVVFDAQTMRDDAVARGVVRGERARVVPLPVHPDFSPGADAAADAEAARLAARGDGGTGTDLLHVGSVAPRKRVDVLLRVLARMAEGEPRVRLLRAGGTLTPELRAEAERLGVSSRVVDLPPLRRPVLAALVRRAAAVLVPSEREGFGLPVLEALACGTPVLASDLPVLREVGGEAAAYARVGDVDAWAAALRSLLTEDGEERGRRRDAGLRIAEAHSVAAYGRGLVDVYRQVLRG